MKLNWVDTMSMIVAEFSDGTHHDFPCNTWSRARIKNKVVYHDDIDEVVSPDIFNAINRYWAMQPQSIIDTIEELYKEIYCILVVNTDVKEVNALLHTAISQLMETFDWEQFKIWCIVHGDLNLQVGIKEVMGENDTFETTYFSKDYEDLVFFSVILKSIMPIWGMYYNLFKDVLGPDHVLIAATDLIRNDYTDKNPAFQKLEQYVAITTHDRVKVPGYSVTSDIGSEEIPNYMLALALWKKVGIFDARAHDKSIVRDVYAILKDKCRRVNNGGPNQKKLITEQGEDISIVDTYKIIQRIPPAVEVIVSHYVTTLNFERHVESTIDHAVVKNIRQNLSKDLVIMEFFIPILAAVCGKHMGNRNLLLIKYESILDIVAVASAALTIWGFPAIAQILITVPSVRDIYSINFTGNKSQIPLTMANLAKLNEIYRYCGVYNPGIKFIESIIKEVNAYTFDIKEGQLENLTNELAELLIRLSYSK